MIIKAPRDEVIAELDRLLADINFSASERNRSFLKYIVTEYFNGRADGIKAYTIAVDVFGRSDDFDPLEDSIVRIEAVRLRLALKNYYHEYPQDIEFNIPKGKYKPEIIIKNIKSTTLKRNHNFKQIFAALLILALSSASVLYFAMNRESVKLSLEPQVSVSIDKNNGELTAEQQIISNNFFTALSRFDTIRLLNGPDALGGDDEASSFSSDIEVVQRKYHLALSINTHPVKNTIHWRVLTNNNVIMQAGVEENEDEKVLISSLVNKLAGYAGIIPWAEGMADFKDPTLGNGCIQRITVTYAAKLGNEFQKDHQCLLQTLEVQPLSADTRAILAQLLVSLAPFDIHNGKAAEALSLARDAVILAPESSRASSALTMALYHNQHLQAAIANGLRTVELNPNEPVLEAYLGWLLYIGGQRAKGVELALKAQGYGHDFSKYDAGSTLILDAYLHEDYSLALHRIDRKIDRWPYLANVLLVATLGQMGRLDEAETAITKLRVLKPEFEATFHDDMRLRSIGEGIKDHIAEGLHKAGLDLTNPSFLLN